MHDKQRIATADNEDADVFGFHFENDMLAVNLFHMRGGKIVDRRDFFWEDLPEFIDETAQRSLAEEDASTTVRSRQRAAPRAPIPCDADAGGRR